MKIIDRLSVALAAVFAASALSAVEVSPEQARTAAQNWITINPNRMDSEFRSKSAEAPITVRTKTGRAVCHAVNMKDGGFVVTSGDTRLPPIIAFSSDGRFTGDESGPFHALLRKNLSGAVSALERSDRKVAASGMVGVDNPYAAAREEWAELLPSRAVSSGDGKYADGSQRSSVSDVRVNTLCKTRWAQWSDVYGYYMPGYAVGCVATAGAQIMKRWEYPKDSLAQFSNKCYVDGKAKTLKSVAGAFDWGNMFLTWDPYVGYPPKSQREAVGKLMYNIGVAVGMEYTPGASSASTDAFAESLHGRFGYKSANLIYYHLTALNKSDATVAPDFKERLADFNNALYASLDAKMPVFMSISGENSNGQDLGHAIIADGYGYISGKRYTHLNFGYDGDEDAWYHIVDESCYLIDNLGVVEDYFEFNGLVFNIHPTTAGDVVSGRVLDASGAAVPGATVSLYDSSDKLKKSVTTDSKGIYSFRVTAVGEYSIVAAYAATDETPSTSVSIDYLTEDGSYGDVWGDGARCGNKWGVDVKFPSWTVPVPKTLTIKSSSTKYGTVSGGGKYMVGKKVTIKAKAKSGNAFGGWFTDKSCKKRLNPAGYDNRKPTVKIVMPSKNTTIYAKFVSKAADKKSLKFSSATKKLAKTPARATAGEEFSLGLGISSASLPTVTAKGLPKGLSIDKATGEITGTPAKPGSYTATVTVKSAAGNKITQKVKIKVLVQTWAKGTYYGKALPGGTSNPPASLKFTLGSTGTVSGKVTYKGKAYSFKAACSSCTSAKAKFSPKIKIGSSTFKPGTVTVKMRSLADAVFITEGTNSKGTFVGQKKANLLKKGGKLAELIGRTLSFTKADKGSGLTKSKDRLDVLFSSGDTVKVSGTVGGKALTALSVPLLVLNSVLVVVDEGMETESYLTRYSLEAYVFDATLRYYKTLAVTVDIGDFGAIVGIAAELQ